MDVTIATEIAYKNGYKADEQAAAKQIFEEFDKLRVEGEVIWTNYAEAALTELKNYAETVLIELMKKYNK